MSAYDGRQRIMSLFILGVYHHNLVAKASSTLSPTQQKANLAAYGQMTTYGSFFLGARKIFSNNHIIRVPIGAGKIYYLLLISYLPLRLTCINSKFVFVER
jgi:hypothetical protein